MDNPSSPLKAFKREKSPELSKWYMGVLTINGQFPLPEVMSQRPGLAGCCNLYTVQTNQSRLGMFSAERNYVQEGLLKQLLNAMSIDKVLANLSVCAQAKCEILPARAYNACG
jgi:hypothetical protein